MAVQRSVRTVARYGGIARDLDQSETYCLRFTGASRPNSWLAESFAINRHASLTPAGCGGLKPVAIATAAGRGNVVNFMASGTKSDLIVRSALPDKPSGFDTPASASPDVGNEIALSSARLNHWGASTVIESACSQPASKGAQSGE